MMASDATVPAADTKSRANSRSTPPTRPQLSVVTTLYRSAGFVGEFYDRILAAADPVFSSIEIVFVNDGSPDDSVDIARRLYEDDPRVVVVDLSRNFGHHRAMMTGLSFARGDLVFLIDVDLEEPPELLPKFHGILKENGCDVVYGYQEKRRGGPIERLSGSAFYWIVDRICDVKLPLNVITARLMTRRYVRNLVRHQEREMIIAGLWTITGFDQYPVPVKKKTSGKATTYGLLRKLMLSIDYITSFSSRLPQYIFLFGAAIATASFLFMVWLLMQFLVLGRPPEGWASLIGSIWLFGGISILVSGLIGMYVARIFIETKRRPYAIVREVYRRNRETASNLPRKTHSGM